MKVVNLKNRLVQIFNFIGRFPFHITVSPQSEAINIYFWNGALPPQEVYSMLDSTIPFGVSVNIKETNNNSLFKLKTAFIYDSFIMK